MASASVLSEYEGKVYKKVKLRIKFRDRVLAGIPRNESVLDYFMNARHMSDEEKEQFIIRVKAGAITDEEKDEIKNTSWCMFEKDPSGNLCIWHGNVKACLREIFVTLGLTQKRPNTKKPKEKKVPSAKDIGKETNNEPEEIVQQTKDDDRNPSAGGRQTLQHAVHVDPLYVPFEKNGKFLTKPDGFVDKIKHISDASGKRSALGRHDFIDAPELTIFLKWPAKGVFSEEEFKTALAVAQDDGLGACRSQGMGKFDVIEWTDLK